MLQSAVFSILMILISKRKVSRDYLAERFSVSKRTVSRYLNVLEDAGVPITSVPGRGGGVMLADDYIIDKSFLTEAETMRIKHALARTADDYDDKANIAIAEKLDSVNKSREQDGYVIKQNDLYIDCGYEQANFLRPRMKILSTAIELSRAVDIKYTDARGCSSYRTIEPYTLVFKSGSWYIYAMCKLRGDFRLFKLSRISDLRMTTDRKTRTRILQRDIRRPRIRVLLARYGKRGGLAGAVRDNRTRHAACSMRGSAYDRRARKTLAVVRLVDKGAQPARARRTDPSRSGTHDASLQIGRVARHIRKYKY